MLGAKTGDNKQDNVEFFFGPNPTSQKSQWATKRDSINSILRPGDELNHTIESEYGRLIIDMNFGGNSVNLEVELNKNAKIG